jgi:CD109 antigen
MIVKISNEFCFDLQKIETKDGDSVVVIYFDDLSDNQICPQVKSYRQHSVAKQKPASVIVYDYYDTCE